MSYAGQTWSTDSKAWASFRLKLALIEEKYDAKARSGEPVAVSKFAEHMNAIIQCELDMAAEQGRAPQLTMPVPSA
jgi:hypothetical protein